MKPRRWFLGMIGSLLPVASAGCLEESDDEGEFDLPGTPVTPSEFALKSGHAKLPLMNTDYNVELDTEGFGDSDPEEDISYTAETDDRFSIVSLNSSHSGTGKVTGSATAAYQTACEVPSTGSYILEVEFAPTTSTRIGVPADGDGMAATEFIVTVVNYEEQQNIGPSPAEFKGARVTTGNGSDELEEFIISTAVTMALGKAFGLGFVARAVIGQIVRSLLGGSLLGLSRRPSEGERIVDQFQADPFDPGWIKLGFHAREGDILCIELATVATLGYELNDSSTDSLATCYSNLFEFRIKEN